MSQSTDLDVRIVTIRFAFSNADLIPLCVKEKTHNEDVGPGERLKGQEIITPTEQVSAAKIIDDLERAGYVLTGGFYQNRPQAGDSRRVHYVVQFVFGRKGATTTVASSNLREALQTLLDEAFWRVRAFQNPFYQGGTMVDGAFAMSINLEARVPRFQPDGNPITARKKDSEGRRTGLPVPIEPQGELFFLENNRPTITIA